MQPRVIFVETFRKLNRRLGKVEEMTEESFMEYLKKSEIDLDDLLDTVDLPQLNLERLAERLEEEFLEEDQKGDEEIEHQFQVIVDCKDEQ